MSVHTTLPLLKMTMILSTCLKDLQHVAQVIEVVLIYWLRGNVEKKYSIFADI